MADRNTVIYGDQIDDSIVGLGLVKNIDDVYSPKFDVNVDGSTIEIDTNTVRVKALGIDTAQLAEEAVTEAKMDIYNAPTIGYYMKFTSNGLEWTDIDDDFVKDDDLFFHEIPTGLIDSSNTTYTLANVPIASTVQVFLNGLLQAPGVGLDYEVNPDSGQTQTIEFTKAPRTNSDLYVHYVTL